MAKRTVSVTATASFDFVIDDEATSDWDGARILDVVEHRRTSTPPVYVEGATQEQVLAHLGIELSVNGRAMGNIDGWADFSPDAAFGSTYGVYWEIDSVEVAPPEENR